jgi:polyhydroxybutyrate depolymerase
MAVQHSTGSAGHVKVRIIIATLLLAVLVGALTLRPDGRAAHGVTAAPPTTVATYQPGAIQQQQLIGGRRRTWTLVMPPIATSPTTSDLPLVVVLHGRGGNGRAMEAFGFDRLGARDRVVLAYPDGLDGSWDDGRQGVDSLTHRDHVDDGAFIDAVIADAVGHHYVDAHRVGIIGYSNGALMASLLSCRPDADVAAYALVSGPGAAGSADQCQPGHPVPMLEVHSLGDPVVPYLGGTVAPANGHARGSTQSVQAWLRMWKQLDGCTESIVDEVGRAGLAVTQTTATGCQAGSTVVQDTTHDATHRWHPGPGFDTTAVTWAFVTSHLGTAA